MSRVIRHRESHDDRIYRQFHAFPQTSPYVINHILATDLEVPVEDLIAALQRHGFTSEPVEYEVDGKRIPYLKLSRPDGAEFDIDWNGTESNFYDGYDIGVDPVTEVAELRMLPYALKDFRSFCALWWTRKVVLGESIPRHTMAWPLMDSAGPEDLSPARKEVMVEHAEKQRIAGLDEENKKLRAKLEAIQKYATDRGMKLLMKLATVEP